MPEILSFSRRRVLQSAAYLVAAAGAAPGLSAVLAGPALAQAPDLMKVQPTDHVLGDPNAKVTIIEYASMTCPHCAGFHTTILPDLKKLYIETGKAKLVFRDFPLDRVAAQASLLAECVAPNQYFAMIDMLFQTQRQWAGAKDPVEALSKAGRLLGIDEVKFRACQDDKAAFAAIIAERQGGESIGVESTPTIFIDGKPYPGVRPIDDYRKLIDPLLE